MTLTDIIKQAMIDALKQNNFNVKKAAKQLQINRNTIYRTLSKQTIQELKNKTKGREVILDVLSRHKSLHKAAKELNIHVSSLYRSIKKYGINRV